MKEIKGKYTTTKIFTDSVEDYAIAQIQMLCDNEALEGCTVRIMPDVHPGKVGTIGFTSTTGDKILPNIIGIDIGCGITMAKIKQKKVEFQKLDKVIRENIPSGFNIRNKPHRFNTEFDFSELICEKAINRRKAELSLGTLGRGNHFIELDKDDNGDLYVTIHSGSRHLGKEVTEYYLNEGQKYLKNKGIQVPYELVYLEGQLKEDYLHDIHIVQEFAMINRETILDELVKGMKWKVDEVFYSIHNYVDLNGIIRKGAISAYKDEIVIIPINMRDGIIIGKGLGNPDWNYSAPHGSGRIMKREDVKSNYTVSQFKNEMKSIYSSCIGKGTLDEAPFAYRSLDMIKDAIKETVEITNILKPVYNYKAGNDK